MKVSQDVGDRWKYILNKCRRNKQAEIEVYCTIYLSLLFSLKARVLTASYKLFFQGT